MESPFLSLPESFWVARNPLVIAFRDLYPVSEGHTLIVPRRVIATWFEATREEQLAILELLDEVKADLDATIGPDGYNVGFNSGAAAGQTIEHLHLHVIPRFDGDVPDPTGGVRHVIPGRGNYRVERAEPLITGGTENPLLRELRPLLRRAREIAIVAAFVQDSGLRVLEEDLLTALEEGARIRLVTGDYLNITQERALRRLLDWERRTIAYSSTLEEEEDEPPLSGTLEVRIVETASLPHPTRAFHPKSWRFEGEGFAAALVGSSNISHSALRTGIEWNVRIDRWFDPEAYERVCTAYEELWNRARPLDEPWLAGYHENVRTTAHPMPPGEEDEEPLEEPLTPNILQQRALDAVAACRAEGGRRALVVMATGLGKTWFAAFDRRAFAEETGAPARVLFLAHRRELLSQAADTFRTAFPEDSIGFFVGAAGDLDADLVFASVQKLARRERLNTLPPDRYDYVIVDEVHHAAAASWRRIIAHLEPRFLLGLTATPDRADEEDILGLFDDHLPYRADLGEGIEEGLLVPFHYQGLKDTVDYAPIPWRNRRFDPAVLEEKIQTQQRMETLWHAWGEHPGRRTLVFCCSIAHAEFTCRWLAERGVRVSSVHSGPESDDRDDCLAALAKGKLDALCSVDLFNEGVDLPAVDRVVMLRPTESPVVFLQQLGRGLRVHEEVEFLQVIDFVGNHRVFLDRVRRLLSLTARPTATSLRDYLTSGVEPELPAGCSIEVELEAKDMLARLLPRPGASAALDAYRSLRLLHGERPLAGDLYRRAYNPRAVGAGQGGWFGFVRDEGDLDERERAALDAAGRWLNELETTAMTKSFKMVVLEVLAEADALNDGMELAELARKSHDRLVRSPELFQEIAEVSALDDPSEPDPAQWLAYWRVNPIAAWSRSRWFEIEGDRLVSRIPRAAEDQDGRALTALTLELVDWRLARHLRDRKPDGAGAPSFVVKVSWNQRDPILILGTGAEREQLPSDEIDVFLPNGKSWRFRFMKIAVNVAHPVGDNRNRLPDLLRGWFGPAAGYPGTDHRIRFTRSPDGWWIEPIAVRLDADLPRGRVLAFPTLEVVAGAVAGVGSGVPGATEVVLPGASPELRAVRACGLSMDGEPDFIRDGDWLLVRWVRGEPVGAVEGRAAIFQRLLETGEPAFQVKRLRRVGDSYELTSDNPQEPSLPADEDAVLVGIVEQVVRPEKLGPEEGTSLATDEIASTFHVSETPSTGASRADGHLFLLIDGIRHLPAPDRCNLEVEDRCPAETAYILIREPSKKTWRYAGVGRWDGGQWAFPALDFAMWRELGGQGASRSLPSARLEAAVRLTERIQRAVPPATIITVQGHRYRILDRTSKGGLRVDGGPGGFKERTVSTQDFAWVLEAGDRAQAASALLDEAIVNRVRYLDATPKASTRWIDTGHALRLVAHLEDK